MEATVVKSMIFESLFFSTKVVFAHAFFDHAGIKDP